MLLYSKTEVNDHSAIVGVTYVQYKHPQFILHILDRKSVATQIPYNAR